MAAVHEATKLVARSLELLKGYIVANNEHEVWESRDVEVSITMLEEALDKLASST